MMKEINAKYIFLDIVAYSKRYLEQQAAAIQRVNEAVHAILTKLNVSKDEHILLPTGDGLCIVLINTISPIDIHLQIALGILELLAIADQSCNENEAVKLRIGINENTDLEVEDINGQRNVVGSGINYAQRLMSIADANQIFLGVTVYEQMRQRASFANKFRAFQNVIIKHKETINAYQYIDPSSPFLNSEIPGALKPKSKERSNVNFPEWLRIYFRYTIIYKDFLKDKSTHDECIAACYYLYFMAQDEVERKNTPDHIKRYPKVPEEGRLDDLFAKFFKTFPNDSPWDWEIAHALADKFSTFTEYFDIHYNPYDFRVIKPNKIEFVKTQIEGS